MNLSQSATVPRALEDSVKVLMAHLGGLADSVSFEGPKNTTAVIKTAGNSRTRLEMSHQGNVKSMIYFAGIDEDVLAKLNGYSTQYGLTVIRQDDSTQNEMSTSQLEGRDSASEFYDQIGFLVEETTKPGFRLK